jgi:hypothetical protein
MKGFEYSTPLSHSNPTGVDCAPCPAQLLRRGFFESGTSSADDDEHCFRAQPLDEGHVNVAVSTDNKRIFQIECFLESSLKTPTDAHGASSPAFVCGAFSLISGTRVASRLLTSMPQSAAISAP